jgi:hypothetical protein
VGYWDVVANITSMTTRSSTAPTPCSPIWARSCSPTILPYYDEVAVATFNMDNYADVDNNLSTHRRG